MRDEQPKNSCRPNSQGRVRRRNNHELMEEVEREEELEVALQGRRPRHLPADNSTIVGNDSLQSSLKPPTEEEEEGLAVSSEISSEEEDKEEDGEFQGERGNGEGKLGKRTSVGEDNGKVNFHL